ncbi:MAG: TRAP transporter permease, partial [Desulfofustis sp.]|nr:TRAP transporter permease [Desulfofustis sp.]
MYPLLGQAQELALGWDFYGPLIGMVVMILLGVRIWVVIGLGSMAMLYFTEVLPLTLLGEALFDGVDSFALIAVPLFILTGDVLVRTGLSLKLLQVAEAAMGWQKAGSGTSTVLGCGFFACISGSDAADAAAISRITIGRLVEKGYPKGYA